MTNIKALIAKGESDRLEFKTSFGKKTIETLSANILSGKNPSAPRNKQIASIFKEAGMIEKYGSGIRRVRLFMQEAQAKEPVFESEAGLFKVTLFPMETRYGGVSGGVSGGVNDLLNFIKTNPGKRSNDIKTALNLPQRTLERWLKQLKKIKKIEFQGAPRTGGYFSIDND
ncbi:MAG: hypothetical protein PF690_11440 [Deltaproteobacteria bacterium]|jgi:ATP-dependent DNA helicase RecG|nr:hypothetical protein [Deltaproteobacteria bacterium]